MSKSSSLYAKAQHVLPGGVNSSTRLNHAIGAPFFASRAEGSRVWDVDGRSFVDMCCGHGAALLGHGHPAIVEAVQKAAALGFAHVFETPYHVELARGICERVPCAERVRFCSAGSEATLHLIRACRAFTGRDKIIRVEGHFHGYHELIYIGGHPPAGRRSENQRRPYIESPGIPAAFADLIIPVPHNDPEALEQAIERYGGEAAMLILEPVNYNCACILPRPGYLERARELTREAGIVLFFDEIQSVFKKSPGGAQQDFGVIPDVCAIGKSIGGGLPLSGFCGRAEIMDQYQPVGPVQHSGTFNAHLVPVLAGLAFLHESAKPGFYPHLRNLEEQFHDGMDRIIRDHDLEMVVPRHGARFNILLGRKTPAQNYEETFCHDKEQMLKLIKACYDRGVYFHDYGGGPIHHGYSVQHTEKDIDEVLNVLESACRGLKR
jgi:glutamate-1-semialdehyde 2,1-aminomutase